MILKLFSEHLSADGKVTCRRKVANTKLMTFNLKASV